MAASNKAYDLGGEPQATDRKTFNWRPLILGLLGQEPEPEGAGRGAVGRSSFSP